MKRRDFLASNLLLAGSVATTANVSQADEPHAGAAAHAVGDPPVARRVRQSVMGWCFKPMDPITLAGHCKRIGLEAIEGIPSKHYDAVTQMGLEISLVGSHGFAKGPLDPANHAEVESRLREGIDLAAKYRAPNVITFTGMTKAGISGSGGQTELLGLLETGDSLRRREEDRPRPRTPQQPRRFTSDEGSSRMGRRSGPLCRFGEGGRFPKFPAAV